MSSDLLAEFDSFYSAPQKDIIGSSATNVSANSAFDDLSLLGNDTTKPNLPQSTWAAPTSNQDGNIWGEFNGLRISSSTQNQQIDQDADVWGEFEEPKPTAAVKGSVGDITGRFGNDRPVLGKPKPMTVQPGIVRVSTADLFSQNISDLAESSARLGGDMSHAHSTYTPPLPKAPRFAQPESDVLFDAGEEFVSDDDDFGDFETVTEKEAQYSQPSAASGSFDQDLLHIDSPPTVDIMQSNIPLQLSSTVLASNQFPYPKAPKSPSFQDRNPFADLALKTETTDIKRGENEKRGVESPVTAWPVFEPTHPKPAPYVDSPVPNGDGDNEWGHFEDLPPEAPNNQSKPSKTVQISNRVVNQMTPTLGTGKIPVKKDKSQLDNAWAWDAVEDFPRQVKPAAPEATPPTNVPPPSVLLSMFPPLLNLPQSSLFQAVANQPFSLKNRIMSDPATIDFLRAYILLSKVLAHLIAGRKLRWKRDNHLSQAMKIGPAAAGGKGGMKLTGVDKTESVREDREASDLVRIWKEQIGRLRSAVAIANSSIQDVSAHLAIPEISETMIVKSVSMAEGGLTAPKSCILCGLKREERVSKVDNEIEDSFGEWWVEHWGHRTCRNFWEEHESNLKQR